MNKKLTRLQKEQINKAFDHIFDVVSETAEIEVEGFGRALTGFSEEGGNEFLALIGTMFKIDFSDRKELWNLEEIKEAEYGDLDEMDEVEYIECFDVDLGDNHKYRYIETIFKHKATGKFLRFQEQRCVKTEETGYFEFMGETEKQEVTTIKWV